MAISVAILKIGSMVTTHPTDAKSVGERLALLRRALGYETQSLFATKLGFGVSQWNNFERGMPLPFPAANKLMAKINGLSLDWIYYGRDGGLSVKLLNQIESQLTKDSGAASA